MIQSKILTFCLSAVMLLLCSCQSLPPPVAGNRPPELLERVAPEYPFSLRREGITGKVEFEFVIETTGEVREVHILSSPYPQFSAATITAVKQWKFRPAVENGVYVRKRLRSDLTFGLSAKDF